MTMIPLRELRNEVSAVLRRAEAGEEMTVTVSGRPVARLGPLGSARPRFVPTEDLLRRLEGHQADAGLTAELREMLPDTTDDIRDPWHR